MISINFGDLAQRARRAFRLVGRLPLALDETVIPVAIVSILDADPYRQEPRTFAWPAAITGTAVLNGIAEISNPAGSSQLIVIKQINAVVTVAPNTLAILLSRGIAGVLAAGISQPVLLNTPNGFLGQPGQSATRFRSGQNAGTTGGQIASITSGVANDQRTFTFADPVVLYPGDLLTLSTGLLVLTWGFTIMGAEYVQTAP